VHDHLNIVAISLLTTISLATPRVVVESTALAHNGGVHENEGRDSGTIAASLQPMFSSKTPALDEDDDEAWEYNGLPLPPRPPQGGAVKRVHDGPDNDDHENARGRNEQERDFWADSSDEDEEYSKARGLLMRANRKRR